MKTTIGFVFIALHLLLCFCCAEESFEESLKLDVIGDDQVYAFFNFSTTWTYEDSFHPLHYRLLPRSLGQLIQKYNVAELHFTLTQGLWRYNQWGFPHSSSPTGAQVWVWFHKDTQDVDKTWVSFTKALSGLFCASLNFINKAVTVNPKLSFRPSGIVEDGKVDNKFLRHGALARENLCTENLTPWMKLLPCGSKAGPGALLNPSQLHHSRFLAIGLHFQHRCHDEACIDRFVELQQHVSAVYDLRTSVYHFPDFSLITIFDRKVKPACPLSKVSEVKIKAPHNTSISPPPTRTDSNGYSIMNLFEINRETNINVKWQHRPGFRIINSKGITHHCYLTGRGLEGGLTCSITNHMQNNITIIFFQVMPWFLHAQFHTLKVLCNQEVIITPTWASFTPAKIRESPHTLELVMSLPGDSVVDLSIQFTKGFLTWTEHPPDGNHGFYISPAMITARTSDYDMKHEAAEVVQRLYSEAILVNIPVPDFSMPYNVICLVCTVLAIGFGSLHNLSTRRFSKVSPKKGHPVKEKLINLINTLRTKLRSRSSLTSTKTALSSGDETPKQT